jgi:hypothetical protein
MPIEVFRRTKSVSSLTIMPIEVFRRTKSVSPPPSVILSIPAMGEGIFWLSTEFFLELNVNRLKNEGLFGTTSTELSECLLVSSLVKLDSLIYCVSDPDTVGLSMSGLSFLVMVNFLKNDVDLFSTGERLNSGLISIDDPEVSFAFDT